MNRLANISATKFIKVMKRFGYQIIRQKGSHIVLQRQDPFSMLVIPNHKEIDIGLIRSLIKEAGLTVEEFLGVQ